MALRILCVADAISPLVHSTNIKDRFRDVDLVMSAGDLPMEYLGFIASSLNKPVIFVFGNHNLKKFEYFKKRQPLLATHDLVPESAGAANYGATYADKRVLRIKKLLIAGLGGSIKYNDGENQYTDFQMYGRMIGMIPALLWNRVRYGRWLDILLTHSAPKGINDRDDPCHRGFGSFLWFMRVFKPKYLLHGHIHLYDSNSIRELRYHQTKVLNVYNYLVIDV